MKLPPTPRFRLTLAAKRRADDADGMRRLRGALKTLLRGWGLRCTWIEYLSEETGDRKQEPGDRSQGRRAGRQTELFHR
jgi:hypothetical protein